MPERLTRRRLNRALERLRQREQAEDAKNRSAHTPQKPGYQYVPPPSVIAIKQIFASFQRRQKSEYKADDDEHRTNERILTKSTRRIAQFTVALVFVGILSAAVSTLQWAEMRSGGEQTNNLIRINSDLATAAKDQAKAAGSQVIAMQGQLDVMEAERRPWAKIEISANDFRLLAVWSG
jgi:hypothetical protein